MKRTLYHLFLIVMAVVMIGCQSEETISFSNETIEESIRVEIDKEEGEIFAEDLDEITELDLSGLELKDLDGLEHLDAVEVLYLQNNNISDFTVLEDMESLQKVTIAGNPYDETAEFLGELSDQDVEVITKLAVEVLGTPNGPGGFLWKVENGETVVYLQGTIHTATEDFYPLNEEIEKAYAEADVIVPEIDLVNLNPMEVQGTTMELAVYQDGTTIEDHIPSDLYEKLDSTLKELGMPIDMLKNYKPWFLSSTIQQLMMQQLGYIQGVDEYFLTRADEDGKEVIGLETVEEQLRIFAETSPEYQIEMLEEALIDLEEFDTQMQEMFDLYKEGDEELLLESLTEEGAEVSEEEQAFMEALNDERNYGMAETIEDFLEEDSGDTYFVIVGSLHLLMEPHVRSILEEAGYEVERVH
ncbi:hypothetical protein SAMN05216389_101340 [Oceanobacillus limi]|uniref:TraB family protein n=1 Tax=Oceanobacillus limi TaxID=930131 RepID=A0A1H9YF62_9BACI|nr:TraB/GumN family protein [Oceanobacillus limi]SES67107.1 hypothetical protein SAMN05216389_101340 [Oceanobacillus limi]